MIRKEKQGVHWLEFELLQQFKELKHGVFLRKQELSFGEELEGSIEKSKARILPLFPKGNLVASTQIHSDVVIPIEEINPSKEPADGMFTVERGKALIIKHADCQAAIFYDPLQKRLANVHSGWRGSVQNIYKKTVELFVQRGSKREDIFVAISPSLGPEFAEFTNYQEELPSFFHQFKIGACHFDFWKASIEQLKQEGILEEHIQVAGICTHATPEEFYSYRRDKTKGRNATVAMLL